MDRGTDTHLWRPLTAAQQQFWNGHCLSPDVPLYNMAWRFDLAIEIDPEAFQQAFIDVARNSDAFCAVFREAVGQPEQATDQNAPMAPDLIDLTPYPDPETALQERMTPLIDAPFDLSQRNHRSKLFRMGPAHWVWVVCQHHIVCDAQSGVVLLDAVSERYARGQRPELPLYFDAVTRIASQETTAPATTSPHLPWTAYGAREGRDPVSKRVIVPVGDGFHEAVYARAAEPAFRLFTPDLTKFALYLTGYAAFLSRISGQETMRIGVPSHNRMSTDDRRTLGLFVEVLPFDIEVDADDSFETLYSKVKTQLGAFLKTAKPNAVQGQGTQAFGHVLNFIQARFGSFAGHPARVTWCHSGAHDAHHGTRLHVMDFNGSGKPQLGLDLNKAILAVQSAEAVAGHFERFMHSCLSDPSAKISHFALIADAEKNEVFASAQGPQEKADKDVTVLELIAGQVARVPDSVAVKCGDETLSYAALWATAGAFAARLKGLGVAKGDPVLLHMRRGPDFLVAVLGVLRAGAVFVPVASNTPQQRAQDIAKLSGARIAFTDDVTSGVFAGTDLAELQVDGAQTTESMREMDSAGSDRAYIIFTSGSTGTPKGVCVDHQGLSRYIQWAGASFSTAATRDYALFSSISFDLTITSLFAPLCAGDRVVIYPERSDPDLAVLDVFNDDDVDVVKLTPSHLSLVCASPNPISRISALVVGGENLSVALARRAREHLSPDIAVFNEYGPTEAVVGCMIHRFDASQDNDASVPVGRPADGVTITIRDAALGLCPFGVIGEICIGGRLAQGYHAGEDEAFLTDPLGLQGRLYRSGDLGVMRPDGRIDYLGRRDGQLKIGGVRVETAEIENALRKVAGVQAVHITTLDKPAAAKTTHCKRCAISSDYPGIVFDADGVCDICHAFEGYKHRAEAYFEPPQTLMTKLEEAAAKSTGAYDVVMLLSGGKDSTYAAYRLAEAGKRVLALTLDNGYISEEAKANIRRVSTHLGWEQRFLHTDAMNAIFVDSLKTHSNVCQGCFKTVYTLAMRLAREEGIPAIVTGLSRGQFFETRLTPDLFKAAAPTARQLDAIVHEARRTYHAEDDAISRLLKTDDFKDGSVLDAVEVIDLYRYIDVPVDEIYTFLESHTPWVRPSDTGRSTNCLINDVGIYVHRAREGFHNYALPYSWDVRMRHKTYDGALSELNDEIDRDRVEQILDEIGFDEPIEGTGSTAQVAAYVAADDTVDLDDLWATFNAHLPRAMHPHHIIKMDALPLTNNGKVDARSLPRPGKQTRPRRATYVAPETEMERRLSAIFGDVLGVSQIGAQDDFFDLGVESLAAITLAVRANEAGIPLPATAVFDHRTIAALALFSETLDVDQGSADDKDTPLFDLDDEDLDAVTKALF